MRRGSAMARHSGSDQCHNQQKPNARLKPTASKLSRHRTKLISGQDRNADICKTGQSEIIERVPSRRKRRRDEIWRSEKGEGERTFMISASLKRLD
jgi:hypothetical protein